MYTAARTRLINDRVGGWIDDGTDNAKAVRGGERKRAPAWTPSIDELDERLGASNWKMVERLM